MSVILHDGIVVCEECRRLFFPDDVTYTSDDQPCEICGRIEDGAAEMPPLELIANE
jgi:hypothetical protein